MHDCEVYVSQQNGPESHTHARRLRGRLSLSLSLSLEVASSRLVTQELRESSQRVVVVIVDVVVARSRTAAFSLAGTVARLAVGDSTAAYLEAMRRTSAPRRELWLSSKGRSCCKNERRERRGPRLGERET